MPEFALDIDGSEIAIDFSQPVTQYPYRTMTPRKRFKEEPRESPNGCLERALAEAANANLNNHVVYGVTLADGRPLYIFFHDEIVIYGWSVEERYW